MWIQFFTLMVNELVDWNGDSGMKNCPVIKVFWSTGVYFMHNVCELAGIEV